MVAVIKTFVTLDWAEATTTAKARSRVFNFMKLCELAFDVKHLENQSYHPTKRDKEYMTEDQYLSLIEENLSKQKDVVFKDCRIEYDSDGDEYSHSTWPWRFHFSSTPKAEIELEDDGLVIQNEGYILKFPDIKKMTMQDFVEGLNICKVKYEFALGGEGE